MVEQNRRPLQIDTESEYKPLALPQILGRGALSPTDEATQNIRKSLKVKLITSSEPLFELSGQYVSEPEPSQQ